MRGKWGLAILAVLLIPALAWAGRVFQWTDKEGQVHITDNIYELPAQVRDRYLQKIEDEARRKYTPEQIRELKEKGDWPPMELVRPPSLKQAETLTEWMGFKIVGSDLEAQRSITDEFRFQWDGFFEERRQIDEGLRQGEALVTAAEEAVNKARLDDMVHGRTGDLAVLPKAEKALAAARAAVAMLKTAKAGLPAKEAALLGGKRAYFHAGEDGGPGSFGLPR